MGFLISGFAFGANEQTMSPSSSQSSEAANLLEATPDSFSETLLLARVNGTLATVPTRLILHKDGRLLASADDFSKWRIRLPAVDPFAVKGKHYFPLDAVDGLEYEIDGAEQMLLLDGRPEVFLPTVITTRGTEFSLPTAHPLGSFLNYDLQLQKQDDADQLGGLLEFGLFNHLGFGTATFLGQGLDVPDRFVRLETAWNRDDPLRMQTFRLGDSISRPGAWGRSVRFGGVQWGTNFATRPDFVPFSLPTVSGEATVPSTVDLYVDNALKLSRKVPYGPFEIPNVPVVTGEGQVKLVVRDALGRESVVTQPYHVSSGLLREDLHDYSYDVGFVRENFALESNEYGRPFAATTHRRGFSDELTGEIRGELLSDQQTVGVGGTYLWSALGVLDASAALSRAASGSGGLLSFGFERQARRLGFGFQTQLATPDFVQLGLPEGQPAPRQVSVARTNFSPNEGGSFFVSYVRQDNRSQSEVEFISAGYAVNILGTYYLSLSALRSLSGEPTTSFGITLTRSLGNRTTGSVNLSSENGEIVPAFQMQQNLPRGNGLGYRVSGEGGDRARGEAAMFLQEDIGTYNLEVARTEETTGYRAGASGGLALLGGEAHVSRRLDDSFALVRVGQYPGVEVYVDNQPITRTDSSGLALLPHLRPYEKNNISIRQQDLPLDAHIGNSRLHAVPARRSGAILEFPVRQVRGALVKIVLENGSPMPAGALVRVDGQTEEFPVANRGETYVTGLALENDLVASWRGQTCTVRISLPRDPGPLPVLGPFVCLDVKP
jgi:outer membrane usher protein